MYFATFPTLFAIKSNVYILIHQYYILNYRRSKCAQSISVRPVLWIYLAGRQNCCFIPSLTNSITLTHQVALQNLFDMSSFHSPGRIPGLCRIGRNFDHHIPAASTRCHSSHCRHPDRIHIRYHTHHQGASVGQNYWGRRHNHIQDLVGNSTETKITFGIFLVVEGKNNLGFDL